MSDMERMIVEMNKRIQDAEAQNQQMERRIKELEGQTNSLGIIEPGQPDFLVGGMILISDPVSVSSESPGEQGTLKTTSRDGSGEGDDDPEVWIVAKLPQPTLSFQSFIAQITATSKITFPEDVGGGAAAVVGEVHGIQEDFNIDDVTFSVADAFDSKIIGTFNIVADGLAAVIENGQLFIQATSSGAGGFIDAGFPGSTPDEGKQYFGIIIKTRLVNQISFGSFGISGSAFAGLNSLGFYSPNILLG